MSMNLKKISDYVWEIPKEGDMNVPARIFTNETLLEYIKKDKTLEQLRNIATLPGVVKHALAMPDAHQGYGFPIGGVLATNIKEGGIISPGGVGFDINCLPGDVEVLTDMGYRKKIKDFEENFVEVENQHNSQGYSLKTSFSKVNVVSLNRKTHRMESKNALFFMKREYREEIIEIKTKLGYTIRATKDHPVLTYDGMKNTEFLKEGDNVAIFPFKGVPYEKINNKIELLSDIPEPQIKELEKRGLWNLSYSNEKISILARLFGYLLGDGLVYFYKDKGYLHAYGQKEDLELLKNDFERLGFSARIYSRKRNHKIPTRYGNVEFTSENHELHVSSRALANLFIALGYPVGNKTTQQFLVPKWIMNGPLWIKRLFLAGFFGAELTSPSTHTKTGFYCPTVSMNKNKQFLDNAREFLIQIMNLLEDFGIKTHALQIRDDFFNKHGETVRLKLLISAEEENLLKLWETVGFEYNTKRSVLANIAVLYIMEKKLLQSKRKEIASRIKEYKRIGLKLNEITSLLKEDIKGGVINERFVERHFYEKASQRIPLSFVSFDEFVERKMRDIGDRGVLFDVIESVREVEYKGIVYDLNVPETHNFVVNGIVVSNCGVRLLRTNLKKEDIKDKRRIIDEMFKNIPSGVGSKAKLRFTQDEIIEAMEKGAEWAVENGFGWKSDLENMEEFGRMKDANPQFVSEKALKRGMPQMGSLGAGNHFLEIQVVENVFDESTSKNFGLEQDQVVIMIHSGSRGLGHQVATDYLMELEKSVDTSKLPDRELVNVEFESELGQKYYKAMASAANYAWNNRQLMTHWVRESFAKVMDSDPKSLGLETIYDVAHNIAKVETHKVNGEKMTLVIQRKGATRSFGPGRKELSEKYQETGQPVIIPGSMGTASYVLVGTTKAEEVSFGSTAHGAGRVMSRHAAIKDFRAEQITKQLENYGVYIRSASWKGIVEEAPQVYKNIDDVVKVSHGAGIGNLVVRLKPIGVIKG